MNNFTMCHQQDFQRCPALDDPFPAAMPVHLPSRRLPPCAPSLIRIHTTKYLPAAAFFSAGTALAMALTVLVIGLTQRKAFSGQPTWLCFLLSRRFFCSSTCLRAT